VPTAAGRQFSFADWEMLHQGLKLDPVLQTISDFLDDNATIVDAIHRDLSNGLKNAHTGRDGLTPQKVPRSLILKYVKNWDFRKLRERIADERLFTELLFVVVEPMNS
jgi:transposase, IS5 family